VAESGQRRPRRIRLPITVARLRIAGQKIDLVIIESGKARNRQGEVAGIGLRKPDPMIYRLALELLDVEPGEAVFVGDRLFEDVRGAAELGMTTVQALWFRADEHPDGAEPDYQAFTQLDVLNVARRLAT
jgi:beta-phosphoglucomutase-like phosphatase (HAD superfamily)